MSFVPKTISPKRGIAFAAFLLLATLIALSDFGFVRDKTNSASLAKSESSEPAVMKADRANSRVETEVVTITPRGFEPAEITRPAGRFVLLVENRTELGDLELRLYNTDRRMHLRERRLSREERDWIEELDLEPGHYVLKETNHSRWSCQFTIAR